jgi:hypothetical protein
MATLNVFRTVLMRSHAAKYAVCVMLACAAAVALAISLLVLAGPVADPARAQVPPTPEATLAGAGDIASCSYNRDEATAKVLDTIRAETTQAGIPTTVITLGDNAYPDGTATQFANCYDPTWGRHRLNSNGSFLTMPSVGNHEYHTSGATPYFNYFGAAAGEPGKGYYSYDRGSWHIIVLNSNCSQVGGCSASSLQGQWLQADLTNQPQTTSCTLAYFHHPLFSSASGQSNAGRPFWDMLYKAGADVILSGHSHYYERFAPQDPLGNKNPDNGIREIVAGTGGAAPINPINTPRAANSEIDSFKPPGGTAYGVLKLDLYQGSYHWEFRPIANETFTDSGNDQCHPPDTIAPTVNAVEPADGATGVALTSNVGATFSEALAPSTINSSTFTLFKQGSTQVAATVTYDATAKKATLDPSTDLEAGAVYTATVKSGSGGVKDVAGNPLGADDAWTFTTAAADTTPPDTVIDPGPSGTVTSSKAKFYFHSTEPNSTFRCSLDSAQYSACTSPKQYTGLANGPHTFQVYATDAAGNRDLDPASSTWTVQR